MGNIGLVKSSMTRATETANIVLKQLPEIEHTSCDLIREGAPCEPDPPSEHWTPEPSEFFQEGSRIEAGFRKHFHPAAWLRMSVHNGSITVMVVKPSGRVSLLE